MRSEEIARICHEVNRGLCNALGDSSQTSWEEAPTWQRESAIDGVEFHQSATGEPTVPQDSHNNWMRQKLEDGWVYGAEKDAEAKTHPCLVPFDHLPREQQLKDHLFVAVVHVLTAEA